MSRGKAYDAQDQNNSTSSDEEQQQRGRPRLRSTEMFANLENQTGQPSNRSESFGLSDLPILSPDRSRPLSPAHTGRLAAPAAPANRFRSRTHTAATPMSIPGAAERLRGIPVRRRSGRGGNDSSDSPSPSPPRDPYFDRPP
ncbi:hypothetical protein CSOJ01_08822 [Colletotrichum sojae]|uniref:Uncharacterized protein n=1 Tax=Colletotrichum sojae TaxID=2175907 RepID=A0A8H6J4P0_9PEZI|nr:hypothetical protein CSOJ01_08822 [Colletotrichum sojae]